MKKITPYIICIALLTIASELKAQVWFPEGNYNFAPPTTFSVDNQQIYTVGKANEDLTKSYWVVAKYDGKSWTKLPILELNKTAEVLQIKAYAGYLYVAGNFTFDNGAYSALVRIKDVSWHGVAKIERINQIPSTISALEVFGGKLVIGGNFNFIGGDSLPYLAGFDGSKFSNILTKLSNCKFCYPNYFVNDLASNDSLLAIAGGFNQIKGKPSKSLYLLNINGKSDSFLTLSPTSTIFDKIALHGRTIYGAGVNTTDKKVSIYKIENGYTSLKLNFDSILRVNELVIFENNLWMNGIVKLSGKIPKSTTSQLSGNTWVDYSSNYPGAKSLYAGRGSLWAIGNAEKPLSIWNTNKHVVRFHENTALVKVKVYLDSNNNCTQEKNERPLGKQLVKLSLPKINKFAITNDLGQAEFLFIIPFNSAKVPFHIILPRNYKISNCAFDSIFRSFTSNVRYLDSIQFPITRRANINDIRVIISAPKGTQVVKNKRMEYVISVENVGSNIVSGILILKKDKLLNSEITDPPGNLLPSKVEWGYANLNPGEKRHFNYSGVASDTHFVDNTILQAQASASISSVQNDFADDDADSIEQIIDNSINPFRKDIYPIPNPGDSISYLLPTNREIRYNISFNNFGTDMVYNAVITDTLDLNLDMSYIQETGSNKAFYTELETDPNNSYRGIIIWHFPDINLTANPLKNFEIPSSGSYIGFKVVMKPLSNGYIVKNTAAVFFDNNYAGKTNTAYCTIANTGIDNISNNYKGVLLYPNPANSQLQFKLPLNVNDKINIINQQGVQVESITIETQNDHYSINVESLNTGIYMVQIIKGTQIFYGKLVKM